MHTVPAKPSFDGRCVYWCALLVLGFAYVSMVLCGRRTPFESGNNAWGDWLGVFLAGPTLYHLSLRHTLRGFDGHPTRALLWNGPGFLVPFFAALHWEWMSSLTHANFSLTARQLSHLNAPGKIAFACEIGGFAAVGAICLRVAWREGILLPYGLAFAGLMSILAAVTGAFGPGYHLHVHHYFLALCLLPFVRFRHPVCFATQAVLAGLFVEGACRWGFDPVWVPGH